MNRDVPSWYITDGAARPTGPFTAEQIVEECRAGRANPAALCWREGMAQWMLLAQVEPFALMTQTGNVVAPPVLPPAASVPVGARPRHSGIVTGFAVVALVLAIPALLGATIPLLREVSIYPAAAALLLSLVGLLVALATQPRLGVGVLSIAAMVASILSAAISSFWMYSSQQAADAIGQQVAKGQKPDHAPALTGLSRLFPPPPPESSYLLAIRRIDEQRIRQGDKLRMEIPVEVVGFTPEQLMYSISGAPPGMTLNTQTGELAWFPTDANEPGTYTITVKVVANEPPRSAERTFTFGLLRRAKLEQGVTSATPRGADSVTRTRPEYRAPPLANGVIVDDSLSVSITKIARRLEETEVTLAFRRVAAQLRERDFRVLFRDDRANEYESHTFYINAHVSDLAGTPPNVGELPVGFTWTARTTVHIPQIAPIAKAELWMADYQLYGHWGRSDGATVPLKFVDVADTHLDFGIPSGQFLAPGAKLKQDENMQVEIGRLAVVDSVTVGEWDRRTESGRWLSLPMIATNADYNARQSERFDLYVQFGDGAVLQYFSVSPEGIPPKARCALAPAFYNKDAAAVGLAGQNVRAVLLYREHNSRQEFCGFIPIPDDVRRHVSQVASEVSPPAAKEGSGQRKAAPRRAEERPESPSSSTAAEADANGPLSGTWMSATGAICRLVDDGAKVVISLESRTQVLHEFNGTLTRRMQADVKHFDGTINAAFAGSSRQHTLRTTATLDDDDHLRLRFPEWPTYDSRGKLLGERAYSEVLTRSGATSR